MVSGEPVVTDPLTVGLAKKQAQTSKSSTVCEFSGNFLHILINFDTVIKEALLVLPANRIRQGSLVGVPREQNWTRKSSTSFVIS